MSPLVCPDDDTEYITAIGNLDEPVLVCYTCKARVIPGKRVYDRIRAVVSEFVEEK